MATTPESFRRVGGGVTTPPVNREIPRPTPLGSSTTIGSAPSLMQSLDGIVSSVAAREQAAQDVAKEVLVSAERTAALMGSVLDRAQTMMGMGVGSVANNGGTGLPMWAAWAQSGMIGLPGLGMGHHTSMMGEGAPLPGYAFPASSVPPSQPLGGGGTEATSSIPPTQPPKRGSGNIEGGVAPGRGRGGGGGKGGGDEAPPGADWPDSFDEGRNLVSGPGGFSLGGIRQNVARSVNRRVSEWGTAVEQTLVDDLGQPIKVDGKVQTRRVPKGSPSTAPGVVNLTDDGNMVADLADSYKPSWRERGVGAAKNIAGSMADGGGLGESITSTLPRVGAIAGVAGMAYQGINYGLDFAESQRSKNQEFQAMLGGSNAEGFSERWKQNLFRLSLRGNMSGADAEAIYKGGVAAYGNQQGLRRQYEASALNLYNQVGMSGTEAAAALNEAVQQGNKNLNDFAKAIKDVSVVAKESGQNAVEARGAFQRAFQQTSTFSSGGAAISGAENVATLQMNMGDKFSDTDFSALNGDLNRMRMAQLLGMEYSDFSGKVMSGGFEGKAILARGQSALIQNAVANIDPKGEIRTAAAAAVKKASPDGKNLDEEAYVRIASDIQQQFDLDPRSMVAAAEAYMGVKMSEDDALSFFIQYATRDKADIDPYTMEMGRQKSRIEAGKKPTKLNTSNRFLLGGETKLFNAKVKKLTDGGMSVSEAQKTVKKNEADRANRDMAKLKKMIGKDFGDEVDLDEVENSSAVYYGKGKKDEVKASIINKAKTEGVYNDVAALYWQNFDEFGKGVQFEVQTSEGKKAVGPVELVRYYSDQLQSNPNAIKIIGGKHGGRTVGDVLGTDMSGNLSKTESGKDAPRHGATDVAKAKKEAGSADGTVKISAEPWLKNFFSFQTGGAAYYEATGETPPASHSTPTTPGG